MSETRFYAVQLNLQQGFIHTGKLDVCNATAAIFDRFKRKIVVRPEYRGYEDQIEAAIRTTGGGHPNYEIVNGDGFQVDTWDKVLYPPTADDGIFKENDVVEIVKTALYDVNGHVQSEAECEEDAKNYVARWKKSA